MSSSLDVTLKLIYIFIGINVFIQTLELLFLKFSWSKGGVWTSDALRLENLPGFKNLFNEKLFTLSLVLRLLLTLFFIFYPNYYVVLFFIVTQLLISIRFRGTFNGGSDYMTLIVLVSSFFILYFSEHIKIVEGGLWFIALQSCLSYFISGVVKVKSSQWRNGQAIAFFINSKFITPYKNSLFQIRVGVLSFLLGWCMIFFEILFPLVLLSKSICIAFLLFGFVFHMLNAYTLGLNRFFLIWITTYPALYYCSEALVSF